MEQLRHVARSGGGDPAIIVAETVDALTRLCPAPSELVPLCRNLVDRNPTCGPLWWLCAHLLARPESISDAWRLAEEIERDATAARLVEELPDGATVMTVGYPAITARALRRCGNVSVLAVLAGDEGVRFVRAMDRAGVEVEPVAPESMLAASRRADSCWSRPRRARRTRSSPRSGAASPRSPPCSADVPVWLVAGRGRRLPAAYVEGIARAAGRRSSRDSPRACVSKVVGPDGVLPMSRDALAAECPAVPELLAHLTDGCSGDGTVMTTPIGCQQPVSGAATAGGDGHWPAGLPQPTARRPGRGRAPADRAPTVTRMWSESGRTRNGVPGATPMPWAARATTAARSSSTPIHKLMPSVPVTSTP